LINKKIVTLFFCIALNTPSILFNLKAYEEYESLDRVIAVVEKSVVTKNELERAINLIIMQFKKANKPVPSQNVLIKEVLDRLIEKKLITQYAELIGIKVENQYLDSVISNIANKNNITVEELRIQIQDEGGNFNEFKEGISYELLLNQVKEREITSKINVSNFEIEDMIKKTTNKALPEFKISHILLKKENGYVLGEEKLNEILNQLKTEAFSNVAIKNSQGPMANKGGVLGWKKIDQLPELFSKEITKMSIGDVSEPLVSGNGIHIIRLDDAKNSNKNNNRIFSEQFNISQILIKTNEVNNEDVIKKKLKNIKNQILEGLKFSEAASQFSEGPSSLLEGALGWVDKNAMLPNYKSSVESSKIGEVSGPFATEVGWVLLLVSEKRNKDITDEKNKLAAKIELLQRKTQIKYNDWYDSLKSQVHIEILLNE
jgi:peptidyl-prolyl cis-trans isomerase SurA